MAKQKQKLTIEKLIGKEPRPEGEQEKIEERLRANMAACFYAVLDAVRAEQYTYLLTAGGRGSTKSSSDSLIIVSELERDPYACALILRKVGNTLRGSVFEQMQWAIDTLGVDDHWEATVAPMEMTNTRTGQKIIFRGLDEPKKIKSIKLKRRFYFKFAWFEELDEFANRREIDNVLDSALRGGKARAMMIGAYNPPKSANNWVNAWAANPEEGAFVHKSDYTMVPREWLGETFIERALGLKERNEREYLHTYMGEVTGTGGAVFNNLTIRRIDAEERRRFAYNPNIGMDFGVVDPNVIIKSFFEATDKRRLLIYEEFYRNEMKTREIAAACKRIAPGGELIRADNAAKQVIVDLREEYKINIVGAGKGKGSRQRGYDWLRDLDEIVIDPTSCPNAAREFVAYEYARDREGKPIERYPDGDDHTIDATAYGNRENIYKSRRTKNHSGKGARQ